MHNFKKISASIPGLDNKLLMEITAVPVVNIANYTYINTVNKCLQNVLCGMQIAKICTMEVGSPDYKYLQPVTTFTSENIL